MTVERHFRSRPGPSAGPVVGLLAYAPRPAALVLGVGLACPGPLDRATGTLGGWAGER
ncbi:MAG TPA: hypothetical protein VG674_20820 [Amycolatopsis sp.]|nr:hypothetical protein [Amycolatopsis sp.]